MRESCCAFCVATRKMTSEVKIMTELRRTLVRFSIGSCFSTYRKIFSFDRYAYRIRQIRISNSRTVRYSRCCQVGTNE